MKSDLMFSAIGWHRELSPRAKDEIGRRFPTLPVGRISNAAGYYIIVRDAKHPTPEEARKTLQTIQRRAHALRDVMPSSALDPLHSFIDQAAVANKSEVRLDDLHEALCDLENACSKAITYVPEGRRRSARELLVREIAGILRDTGEIIDSKPKGMFCELLDIILRDVGEKPSDVRKLVQPILCALENSPKKAGAFSKKVC